MKRKKFSKIFSSTVFLVNVVTLLVFLLSAFSDRVSPCSIMLFAFLGLVFPFLLLINMLFAIWWLLLFKWKFLLANIVVFIICSGQIFTYFPFNSKTKEIPNDCIKILTYNVMRYNQYKNHTEEKPNGIITYILELDADIACIQEYGAVAGMPRLISEEKIDKAFKKKYPYRKHLTIINSGGEISGNAVYSKFPIKSSQKIPFESRHNGSFCLELDINGKNVTLINNHLESNKLSSGDIVGYNELLKGIKTLDSKKIEAMSDVMKNRLSVSYRARAKQAELVSEYVRNSKNPYIIVCGDFNDTPISYSRHTIMSGLLKDAFAETGLGMGVSYNKNKFWFRIDYILYSKNIKAYNCTVDKIKDSDHYPVWTYLQLN